MPYYLFIWNEDRLSHLDEHGISADEFEFVVCRPLKVTVSRSSGRCIAFGLVQGRQLACVYEMFDELHVLPITAFEVD